MTSFDLDFNLYDGVIKGNGGNTCTVLRGGISRIYSTIL